MLPASGEASRPGDALRTSRLNTSVSKQAPGGLHQTPVNHVASKGSSLLRHHRLLKPIHTETLSCSPTRPSALKLSLGNNTKEKQQKQLRCCGYLPLDSLLLVPVSVIMVSRRSGYPETTSFLLRGGCFQATVKLVVIIAESDLT